MPRQRSAARISAAYISFRTARSPKAWGITLVRRRSSPNSRSSRLVVRITRRWPSGKRRCAMQASKSLLLVELGRRTALAGDNYFRAKAYQRAADSLSALVEPLDRVIAENRLRQVPGIGETIADIVTKLHRTGTHSLLENLRKDVPEGVLDMLAIPGLKPEKINILHKELGITDLAALEAAAREGRLKSIKGLGPTMQRKILEGLKICEHAQG